MTIEIKPAQLVAAVIALWVMVVIAGGVARYVDAVAAELRKWN